MRYLGKAIFLAGALTLSAAVTTPSQAAPTVELAKQCRAMMIKAHPTQAFGPNGTGATQRNYFQQCLSRQGRMEGQSEPTTTGSGGGMGESERER